jgi:ornithine carbamoyltransferase
MVMLEALKKGAHVTYLDPTGFQLGKKKSIRDTARAGPHVPRHRVPGL